MEKIVSILNELSRQADENRKTALAKHDWVHVNQELGKIALIDELLGKISEISSSETVTTENWEGNLDSIFDWLRDQVAWNEIIEMHWDGTKPKQYIEHSRLASIIDEAEEKSKTDSCEWFIYDYRTLAPKYHEVDNPYWRIPKDTDRLKFCPYCGKKIIIVK